MKNLKSWLHNYENLNPEQQLEVAKAIVERLEQQQMYFPKNDQGRKAVIIFLKKLLNSASRKDKIAENNSLLNRFLELSQENQEKAIEEIFEVMNLAIMAQENEKNKEICEHDGHLFGEWQDGSWTTIEKGIIDHEVVESAETKYYWWRTCSRCGFTEKVNIEPQELSDKREEEERKEQIKKLELEIKALKGEK